MTDATTEPLEAVVRAVPGARRGARTRGRRRAPRVALQQEQGGDRAELKVAAGREVAALEVVAAVAGALRAATGRGEALRVHVEIASID